MLMLCRLLTFDADAVAAVLALGWSVMLAQQTNWLNRSACFCRDVFRFPPQRNLFCAFVGTGTQLLALAVRSLSSSLEPWRAC